MRVLISAALVYSISAYRRLHTKAPPEPPQPKPVVAAVPIVRFPPLRLQSIVFHGARSTALINGRVLGVGEEVELVQIVDIRSDHVTVALQGQTNVLSLGDSPREKF